MTEVVGWFCVKCGSAKTEESRVCVECGGNEFSEPVHAVAIAETIHAGSNVNGGEGDLTDLRFTCPVCGQPTSGISRAQVLNEVYTRYLPCGHGVRADA